MKQQQAVFRMLGLMSGSSLDGLDIAYCKITTSGNYEFEIIAADTIPFSPEQITYLKNIQPDVHRDYTAEHDFFANLSAAAIRVFLNKYQLEKPHAIASHGHTVFHYPALGKTLQIGDGNRIATLTGITTIYNFRQADIDAGGQGAPLVPLCDARFFNNYHACLNIGGIANISFETEAGRIGFDICGANQLLNYIAGTVGLEYDENGELAAEGQVDTSLLEELNNCSYFNLPFPKSLDNHFVRKYFIDRIAASRIPVNDKLATAVEHMAQQIAAVILKQQNIEIPYRLLVTGGGAFNGYLISRIEQAAQIKIQLPTIQLIQYKEALAMCLMGVERLKNKANFLPSVTGAKTAVCGGDIATPNTEK